MSLLPTLFVDRQPNLKFDITRLISEYNLNEDKMEDVTNHGNAVLVQRKFHLLKNGVYQDVSSMPYTAEVIDSVMQMQEFDSVTYRIVLPNTCYNWHVDTGKFCVHIPLITNPGCRFVYETRAFSMPADGSAYVVNNGIPHTFVNAGTDPRLHLAFENL
jgi:hypothetical protein